jgi:ubiquinone/menaquinone biosynthesis C-methylase UbiE
VSAKPSTDFSRIADRYDASREMPPGVLASALEELVRRGAWLPRHRVLDAGCGTGWLSLPLARAGLKVVGVDISLSMLLVAQSLVSPNLRVSFQVADAQALPYADSTFDVAVASKLFQHVGEWRLAADEVLRTLKPSGCFVHINEQGAFRNAVRRRFETVADAMGYRQRYRGLADRSQLQAHFSSRGCRHQVLDSEGFSWKKVVSYGQALQDFRDGLFAEFWGVPPDEYQKMIQVVDQWVRDQPQGYDTREEMNPHLLVEMFERR